MRKLSRFGAAALAMALSLTMVAPLSANAEVNWTKDAEGNKTFINEDTKQSLSQKDYSGDLEEVLESEIKVKTIAVNSQNETIELKTTKDVAKFTNFKSNKKKALKVKVIKKDEFTDPANPKDHCEPDYTDKDENAYYKNVDGQIVKVEKAKKDTDLPKGGDKGEYTIKLFAKKAGTYKFTYDAVLKDGRTVKKTIKVIAKDDGAPIKTITYAGKVVYASVDTDAPNTNPLWTKGFGRLTTTKAKGKIKVTANKDIKIKKIEVGTPKLKTEPAPAEMADIYTSITTYDEAKSNLDYGTEYEYATVSWKTVKNGKTMKLSKVDEAIIEDGGWSYKNHEYVRNSTSTTSYIRVTYYDKKNKTTNRVYFQIELAKK